MKVVLQFLFLASFITASHLLTSPFTYTIVSRLKSGHYLIPIFGFRCESWLVYVLVSIALIQPIYYLGGILVFIAHRFGLVSFQTAYVSAIVNLIVLNLTTVYFMYSKVGELPNKYGWMSLFLTLLASLFAILASKHP